MKTHERLFEDYEDACFALLMERIAKQEGERLEALNQDLLADPARAREPTPLQDHFSVLPEEDNPAG